VAELLNLEFDGVTESDYRRVSAQLGIDLDTGKGDWPPGLISHLAGMSEDGRGVIVESWTSRDAQADFMEKRLGPAQAEGGVTAQPKAPGRTSSGSTTRANKG
jgi:hypothetical protein